MEALTFSNGTLKWVPVALTTDEDFTTESGLSLSAVKVFATRGDSTEHVRCSGCGKIVPNTKEEKRKHKLAHTKVLQCFNCESCRREREIVKTTETKKDGHKYETVVYEHKPYCRNGWRTYEVTEEFMQDSCIYRNCRTAKWVAIENFWTKYPNPFPNLVTAVAVVALAKKECDFYRLKGKHKIKVNMSEQIVRGFRVYSQRFGTLREVRFSETYDCMFINYLTIDEYVQKTSYSYEIEDKTRFLKSVESQIRKFYKQVAEMNK